MRTEQPVAIRLQDYRPPDFLVDAVALEFRLAPGATRVTGRLTLRRQGAPDAPLVLNGIGLTPIRFALDGSPLSPDAYAIGP